MTLWAVAVAGSVAVVFAAGMLFSRSLYFSAVCLLVVLLQTALIFVLRGAPLLGLLQLMIYAGAVMVLVVITIMASGGAAAGHRFADFALSRPLAALGIAAVAVELALTFSAAPARAAFPAPPGGLASAFSAELFRGYALATEAVTLLMFLAALSILPDKEAA
jgi:NADH-quinone oxidoreductase subunit J